MFIRDSNLYAIDVYTGRHLWRKNVSSSARSEDGMVAVPGAIYLASGKSCAVFDSVNGKKVREINVPDGVTQNWRPRPTDCYSVGRIGKLHRHVLCHTYLVRLYNVEHDLRSVQDQASHASPRTKGSNIRLSR